MWGLHNVPLLFKMIGNGIDWTLYIVQIWIIQDLKPLGIVYHGFWLDLLCCSQAWSGFLETDWSMNLRISVWFSAYENWIYHKSSNDGTFSLPKKLIANAASVFFFDSTNTIHNPTSLEWVWWIAIAAHQSMGIGRTRINVRFFSSDRGVIVTVILCHCSQYQGLDDMYNDG